MTSGERLPRPRTPAGIRPVYLGNAHEERLLSMLLALATEVSVLTEELADLRELLVAEGVVDAKRLDAYRPDETAATLRARRRNELIGRLLRIVLEDLDGPAAEQRHRDYLALIEELAR